MPLLRSAAGGRVRSVVAVAGLLALSGWFVATDATWVDQAGIVAVGPGGQPLVSTSFRVEQRVPGGTWVGGDASTPVSAVPFGEAAHDLRPGVPVYGGVEVRTVRGSLGGSLTVAPAVAVTGQQADADGVLWSSLALGIVALPEGEAGGASCDSSSFGASSGAVVLYDGSLATDTASSGVDLAGDSGGSVLLCFRVTLTAPEGSAALQPREVQASWPLDATSDS
jgi:hypothetical protein